MSVRTLRQLRERLRRIPLFAYTFHRAKNALLPFHAGMRQTPLGFRLMGHKEMRAGTFEPDQVELIKSLLASHDILVDVGANIGLYTCLARSLGRPAIAVEPLAANLKVLRKNLSANGWDDTEIAAVGLAEQRGEAVLYGTDTGASLHRGWAGLPNNTLLHERINLETLDGLLGDRFPNRKLLIKVDVEGAEYRLLVGAHRTLSRSPAPTWIVELSLTANYPEGRNPSYLETFEMFFNHGYEARTAVASSRAVTFDEVRHWSATGRCESGADIYIFSKP